MSKAVPIPDSWKPFPDHTHLPDSCCGEQRPAGDGEWQALPNHLQLPESDGTFEKNFQKHPQSIILTDSLEPVLQVLHPDGQYAIGQDCGIYWRLTTPPEPPSSGAEAPDWFLVVGVPPTLEGRYRRSYVLWQEHISPLVIMEFVSGDGSEERDRTPGKGKYWIYEQVIRPAYYVIFEAEAGRLAVYQLVGSRFQRLRANKNHHYPIEELGVELGLWQGQYLKVDTTWLRWWDAKGVLLPTGHERAAREGKKADRAQKKAAQAHKKAEQEQERASQAQKKALEERRRAERLAGKLRALGVDPDADE